MTTAGGTLDPSGATGAVTSIPKNCLELPPLPRAADLLFASNTESSIYWDRSHYDSPESQIKALARSSTLYIGNLAFSTRSSHIRAHFGQIGPVKAVHVGLDRFRKTPCGFCFVVYENRADALLAVANLSGTKLDGRVIRVELDAGFQPGRQYGRGASGGQVRDDRRSMSDPARRSRNNNRQLNWTPPNQAPQEDNGENTSGASFFGSGDKRDRDEMGSNPDMTDRQDKNPRFRED